MHTDNGPSTLWRRWLCPGSLRIEKNSPPERATKEATSGTICHKAMFDILAGNKLDPLTEEQTESVRYAIESLSAIVPWQTGKLAVDGCATGRTDDGGIWYAERQLDCRLTMGEECEVGTIDFYVKYPDRIVLVDFKFGGKFVDHPRKNFQLWDYALAIQATLPKYVPTIAHIIQPSTGDNPMDPWTYDVAEYDTMIDQIQTIRKRARMPDAVLNPGLACQFCRGRRDCPARTQFARTLDVDFESLTPIERGRALTALKLLNEESKRAMDHCHQLMKEEGVLVNGWYVQVVSGSRPHTRLAQEKH